MAEAKARKKRRMSRALTKLKKKAEAVAEKSDMSEREKARHRFKQRERENSTKTHKNRPHSSSPSYLKGCSYTHPTYISDAVRLFFLINQAQEVEKMYKKRMPDQKRPPKKLVVGRAFSARSGKTGRNVKMVDARTRSDTRGDKQKKSREKAGVNKNRKGPKQHKAKSYNRKGRK